RPAEERKSSRRKHQGRCRPASRSQGAAAAETGRIRSCSHEPGGRGLDLRPRPPGSLDTEMPAALPAGDGGDLPERRPAGLARPLALGEVGAAEEDPAPAFTDRHRAAAILAGLLDDDVLEVLAESARGGRAAVSELFLELLGDGLGAAAL